MTWELSRSLGGANGPHFAIHGPDMSLYIYEDSAEDKQLKPETYQVITDALNEMGDTAFKEDK